MILKNTLERRLRKKRRIRAKIVGTARRPRLTVYRSLRHVYAQLVDDTTGKTVVSASSLSKDLRDQVKGVAKEQEICKLVGMAMAKKALEKSITEALFDRNGYLYHGRVKAVAEGAREAGLKF
ncbi:MAG: 50S ribosomal protein L18 [Ignavibacteriales bacterium]|nr:50S ribosomal protein L18 [Ignavibacteriales bacterium]